jgi:hypothetical protein
MLLKRNIDEERGHPRLRYVGFHQRIASSKRAEGQPKVKA